MFAFRKIFSKPLFFNFINHKKHILLVRTYTKLSDYDERYITVRVTPKDYPCVLDLFRYSYFNSEPTLVAAGLAYKYNPLLENKILECLSQGLSLMTKCRTDGSIVGAAVNGTVCPWDPDLFDQFANTCTCVKLAEVLKFYAHISRAGNLWEKYKERKIFEIAYLVTDGINQQCGIGLNLIKKSLLLGKDLTYNVIRVDATNFYTQKICQKLNMTLAHEFPYTNYKNRYGKTPIVPPDPHRSVQIYVYLPHICPSTFAKNP